jgi:hypothetical protein
MYEIRRCISRHQASECRGRDVLRLTLGAPADWASGALQGLYKHHLIEARLRWQHVRRLHGGGEERVADTVFAPVHVQGVH